MKPFSEYYLYKPSKGIFIGYDFYSDVKEILCNDKKEPLINKVYTQITML